MSSGATIGQLWNYSQTLIVSSDPPVESGGRSVFCTQHALKCPARRALLNGLLTIVAAA
jgi:hypothetical protein